MKIFQYAAIYVPKSERKDSADTAKIIVEPTNVLAKDDKQAAMLAARAIPEEYLSKLDQVDIIVRPF